MIRISPKFIRNLIAGKPVLAIFEICLTCNSKCGYCDLPLNLGRAELTRDEIRRIFTGLYREGIRYLFIQGGEPLTRRDAIEVMEDLAEIGFGMTLVTNGTRLTPEIIQRLELMEASIAVSLDTLDRARYAFIRGADQLPRVLKGIDMLRDFSRPKHLTCIVSEVNRDELELVGAFARERGFVPVFGAYHWEVGGYGKSDARLQYERHAALKVFEDLARSKLVPAGYFRNFVRDSVTWLRGGKLEPCDAGRHAIAIDASGNVSACLAQPHAGNLKRQSLAEILDAMDMDQVRACSAASTCNLLCSRVVGSAIRHPLSGAVALAQRRVLRAG